MYDSSFGGVTDCEIGHNGVIATAGNHLRQFEADGEMPPLGIVLFREGYDFYLGILPFKKADLQAEAAKKILMQKGFMSYGIVPAAYNPEDCSIKIPQELRSLAGLDELAILASFGDGVVEVFCKEVFEKIDRRISGEESTRLDLLLQTKY